MTHAIILAGGSGKRFWPVSRRSVPKQLLPICSDRPLLADTIRRIGSFVKYPDIYVAAGAAHRSQVRAVLGKRIRTQNLIFEPASRNTLAPIAVLSKRIHDRDLNAVIVVMPSDHHIRNDRLFRRALAGAIACAQRRNIVTLGIRPTRPETGYGYIKAGPSYKIERFIEKPDLARAKQFLRTKNYYWNSGIFVFRADVVMKEIKHLAPQVYETLRRLEKQKGFAAAWETLPDISFDYAIMEKTSRGVVIPCDFGWTDVGSWQALTEILPKDSRGNIFRGAHIDMGSTDTFVWSGPRLVATCGLDGVIIVDTKDALLVAAKDKSQDVKKIVERLSAGKLRGLL